jgi:hypothetical protein
MDRVSKIRRVQPQRGNSIAIAPVTAAVSIHKNALALLGGVPSKGPLSCLEFREGAVFTALYIPHEPVNRQ